MDGRILLSFKPPGFFSNKYLHIRKDLLDQEMRQLAIENPDDFSSDEDPTMPESSLGGAFGVLADEDYEE